MVEGNGLENRRAGNGTVGSNPTPSARKTENIACNILWLSLKEKVSVSNPMRFGVAKAKKDGVRYPTPSARKRTAR